MANLTMEQRLFCGFAFDAALLSMFLVYRKGAVCGVALPGAVCGVLPSEQFGLP